MWIVTVVWYLNRNVRPRTWCYSNTSWTILIAITRVFFYNYCTLYILSYCFILMYALHNFVTVCYSYIQHLLLQECFNKIQFSTVQTLQKWKTTTFLLINNRQFCIICHLKVCLAPVLHSFKTRQHASRRTRKALLGPECQYLRHSLRSLGGDNESLFFTSFFDTHGDVQVSGW